MSSKIQTLDLGHSAQLTSFRHKKSVCLSFTFWLRMERMAFSTSALFSMSTVQTCG